MKVWCVLNKVKPIYYVNYAHNIIPYKVIFHHLIHIYINIPNNKTLMNIPHFKAAYNYQNHKVISQYIKMQYTKIQVQQMHRIFYKIIIKKYNNFCWNNENNTNKTMHYNNKMNPYTMITVQLRNYIINVNKIKNKVLLY